jgi:hypothetical protein
MAPRFAEEAKMSVKHTINRTAVLAAMMVHLSSHEFSAQRCPPRNNQLCARTI